LIDAMLDASAALWKQHVRLHQSGLQTGGEPQMQPLK
jgi:hypothetical protein